MDHGLVSEDTEEASHEGQDVDEAEDRDSDQKLLLLRLQLQSLPRETSEQIRGLARARARRRARFRRAVDRLRLGNRHDWKEGELGREKFENLSVIWIVKLIMIVDFPWKL